jgi:hypothetical protein
LIKINNGPKSQNSPPSANASALIIPAVVPMPGAC